MEVAVEENSQQFLLIDRTSKSFDDKIRLFVKNIDDMEMLGRHLKGTINALIASKSTLKPMSKKRRKSGGVEAVVEEAIAMNAGDAISPSSSDDLKWQRR